MKTNSFSRKNSGHKGNIILGKLATKIINKVARISEYTKRSNGKISPKSLILGFMLMVSKQRNTYSDWATEIGLLENKTIAKQSLNERMNPQTECFIKKVLEQQLCEKAHRLQTKKVKGLFKNFNNVMIDHSTTLHLPDELAKEFPGNVSRGEKKAQAKIHAMYNLTENNFPFFHIHSFSNNDQSLSAHVLPHLKEGDLCIRDLGFLVLDVVEQFIEKQIYFISRKNYQTKIYDIKTGEEINLVKVLRRKKNFDKEVMIGKNVIRVKCIIYLMLLYIYLFHVVWWRYCENEIENESVLGGKTLSILKMANFFRQHFTELLTQKSDKEIIKQLTAHCLYDKRKDRDNAKQFQFKMAA